MNVGTQILLLLLALGLMSFYTGRRKVRTLIDQWAAFRQWQAAGMPQATPSPATRPNTSEEPYRGIDTTLLPGAGNALKSPPADLRAIVQYIRTVRGGDP